MRSHKTAGMETMHFCTIINYRFLPYFLVQQETFREILKDRFQFWVFCIDYETFSFLKKAAFAGVIPVYWRDIADQGLLQQREKFKYKIPNFCWVSKAFFLKYLLFEKKISKVVYVDADIILLSNPAIIFSKHLNERNICLTPHHFSQKRKQGDWKKKYGVYNAGFIAVNQKAVAFLNWWQRKCYDRCGRYPDLKPEEGGLDDQGYLDAVPKLFSGVRNLGREFNIGPWNCASAKNRGGKWFEGKIPVIFYHFHQMKIEDWKVVRVLLATDIFSIEPVAALYEKYQLRLDRLKCQYGKAGVENQLSRFFQKENSMELLRAFKKMGAGSSLNSELENALFLLYHFASRDKAALPQKSRKRFEYIAKFGSFISDELRGGTYFHLGELEVAAGSFQKARSYFESCLHRIPEHQKAKEKLKALTK